MYKVVLGSMLALAAVTASAKIDSDGAPTKVNLSGSFEEQRVAILKDLDGGKVYSEISAKERGDVKDALNRISGVLQAPSGVQGLNEEQKAKVFNDQELVNAILTRAGEDSRLVCTREKVVGSHRPTTQCFTVAERRRMRESDQDTLRQKNRVILRGNN
ncbi:hypothetical protein SAMN05428982_0929 [Pseudoxanthomonas sp. CF385]|uniref:hypothetical protein n=1 Tax=Pseudoxanthomonas sp. CF385 TaxID=1881042 RepID=UPI000886DF52|nr:hypothetical protein [Pseudoxanthomonas sp. CF385]SDQ38991.1 hypothetical protein SAMN05428982_0929 [Pseudoxanthomonas sp. CF385]